MQISTFEKGFENKNQVTSQIEHVYFKTEDTIHINAKLAQSHPLDFQKAHASQSVLYRSNVLVEHNNHSFESFKTCLRIRTELEGQRAYSKEPLQAQAPHSSNTGLVSHSTWQKYWSFQRG